MKKVNLLIFVLVIIVAVLALTMLLQQTPELQPPTEQVVAPAPPTPEKKPIVHYPVPTPVEDPTKTTENPPQTSTPPPAPPEKLPPVEQSEKNFAEALDKLNLKKSLFLLIAPENFIQRLVTTIDNLPEKRLPRAHLPLAPPKGRYIVSGTSEAPQTSPRNQARYTAHVQLLEALDPELVVKMYVYFYPLFQTAYEQLGYQNAYFNDRLVNVIEHLLETPQPAEPIPLDQPSVLYVYADPLLEGLSSGQKTLLRIGPEHRDKVLQILGKYRQKLINLHP